MYIDVRTTGMHVLCLQIVGMSSIVMLVISNQSVCTNNRQELKCEHETHSTSYSVVLILPSSLHILLFSYCQAHFIFCCSHIAKLTSNLSSKQFGLISVLFSSIYLATLVIRPELLGSTEMVKFQVIIQLVLIAT